MAQSNEMRARAKKLQDRPVCVTLHSGETYVGYITDVNCGGWYLPVLEPPHALLPGSKAPDLPNAELVRMPRASVSAIGEAERANRPSVRAPASQTLRCRHSYR